MCKEGVNSELSFYLCKVGKSMMNFIPMRYDQELVY